MSDQVKYKKYVKEDLRKIKYFHVKMVQTWAPLDTHVWTILSFLES